MASLSTIKLYLYLCPVRGTVCVKAPVPHVRFRGKSFTYKPDSGGTFHFVPISDVWKADLKAELVCLNQEYLNPFWLETP